jgi:hypothetical protein
MRRVLLSRGPLLDSGPQRVDFANRTHPDFVIADVVANPSSGPLTKSTWSKPTGYRG